MVSTHISKFLEVLLQCSSGLQFLLSLFTTLTVSMVIIMKVAVVIPSSVGSQEISVVQIFSVNKSDNLLVKFQLSALLALSSTMNELFLESSQMNLHHLPGATSGLWIQLLIRRVIKTVLEQLVLLRDRLLQKNLRENARAR